VSSAIYVPEGCEWQPDPNNPEGRGTVVCPPISGDTIQRALSVLGFNPGPIDGIIGERTLAAFDALTDSMGITAATITISADQRSADVPDGNIRQKILEAAPRYVAATGPSPRGSLVPDAPSSIAPATFWRASNPWAWGAALVPLALFLGGFGYFLTRKR
jgi:hypothetical protein